MLSLSRDLNAAKTLTEGRGGYPVRTASEESQLKSRTKGGDNNTSPFWWERVVVAILLVTAAVYARSAMPVTKSSGCSPKVLQTMARIYMSKGNYDKAEELVNKALNAVAAEEDTDEVTSSCLIDLAWLYKKQGRLAEAEELCLTGLKLQQKVYFSRHPYIAYTLRILSSIYQAQAKYDQADAALDKAAAIMSTCHLPDDPVLAPFEVDAAGLLAAEGRFEMAEVKYEQALRTISDYYGPEHLYTAGVMADLGKLYYLQGRYELAERMLSFATEIQQKTYGRNNQILASNWLTMAKIYQQRGDFSKAEKFLNMALKTVGTNSGNSHPFKGELLAAKAELMFDSCKYTEAETACLRAIDALKKSVGPDNDTTAMALNCLAKLKIVGGNFEEGYAMACDALTTVENVLGSRHPKAALVNETIEMSQELDGRTTPPAIAFGLSTQNSTLTARYLSSIE